VISPIDESTAWELVREVNPGAVTGTSLLRVTPDSDDQVWLEIDSGGSWETSTYVSDAARDVLDIYLPIQLAQDLVIGQLGQSLDGHIATETGASHFVTGKKDIERLHRLRALVDAVIVGAITVAYDDPRLTVRLAEGPNPVRVVLDPSKRLDAEHRVFSDGSARTLVVRPAPEAATSGEVTPEAAMSGAIPEAPTSGEVAHELLYVLWSRPDGLDLPALLERLRARGLRRILVEGGGVTVSRFLQAGLLDRLHISVAPILIGSGRPSITLDPIEGLDQALRPRCRHFKLGEDVLFDLDLRSGPA